MTEIGQNCSQSLSSHIAVDTSLPLSDEERMKKVEELQVKTSSVARLTDNKFSSTCNYPNLLWGLTRHMNRLCQLSERINIALYFPLRSSNFKFDRMCYTMNVETWLQYFTYHLHPATNVGSISGSNCKDYLQNVQLRQELVKDCILQREFTSSVDLRIYF